MTYHWYNMDQKLMELYNLIQTAETRLKKAPIYSQAPVLAIHNGGGK